MSLIRKIKDYYKKQKRILFTTPSHSLGNFIIPEAQKLLGKKFFRTDFSEIEGLDNLRHPEGAIKELLTKISGIYRSKGSFILTNGSTSGLLAAMLAILKQGDKVLVARNCHISVCNGLVLTGARPIWFLPEYDKDWSIYKGVKAADIQKYLEDNEDIKALILTSPTYEGLVSDIKSISVICKKHNVKLIVDEAHGALFNFLNNDFQPAILEGADISVESLHKTAGAPNPCAVLHVGQTSDINTSSIQDALNLIDTTSPSYPLICAAEACIDYLNSIQGKKHLHKLLEDINSFKNSLRSIVDFYADNNDSTRLLMRLKNKNNAEAAEILNKKYGIEEEYSTNSFMLFITGIGTDKTKLKRLKNALKKVYKNLGNISDKHKYETYNIPTMALTPAEAYTKDYEIIDTSKSAGRIAYETIAAYPPGIPVIIPGEVITLQSLFLIEKNKIKVIK